MSDFAKVAAKRNIALTTFKKDGTAVATPVWGAPRGEQLLILTDTTSWKVRRIRQNPRATVAACTARGQLTSEPINGTVEILDAASIQEAITAIAKKYGVLGRLGIRFTMLRSGKDRSGGLAFTPAGST